MTKQVPDESDYASFAKTLHDLAKIIASSRPAEIPHRRALRDAAKALYLALEADTSEDEDEIANMTPEEEVRLLHIME